MSEEIDRNAIIREFTEVVGEHFVKLFKLLQLETHIEVMLRNDPTNEEWILSLKKIPHYLKDLDRDKKIESQSDELRQLRETNIRIAENFAALQVRLGEECAKSNSLTAEVEKLKGLLERCKKFILDDVQNLADYMPQSMISEAVSITKTIEEIESTLNPGER